MTIQRRGFLASILATGFAPAVVGSGILMPVRAIARPFSVISFNGRTIVLPRGHLDRFDLVNDSAGPLQIDRGAAGNVVVRSGRMVTAVKRPDGTWRIAEQS